MDSSDFSVFVCVFVGRGVIRIDALACYCLQIVPCLQQLLGQRSPERTWRAGLSQDPEPSLIPAVPSTTTKTERGHSSLLRTLSGLQTAMGHVTVLLDVIFQNHTSL